MADKKRASVVVRIAKERVEQLPRIPNAEESVESFFDCLFSGSPGTLNVLDVAGNVVATIYRD